MRRSEGTKKALAAEAAGASGSFTRPGLVIPCRVARQQSPTPFRQTEAVYRNDGGVEQVHPVRFPGRDGFAKRTYLTGSQHGMQLKTILNRVEPFKSFVYGKVKWVEGRRATDARSGGACPEERPADLLGVRSARAGLRPASRAAFRVRAPVGDRRVFRVCPAAGGLSELRGDGGARALGPGENAT